MSDNLIKVKKFNAVAIKNFNDYINRTGEEYLSLLDLSDRLNSGKTKYSYFDVLYYCVHALLNGLKDESINDKKISKYLYFIRLISSADRGDLVYDPIITSEFAFIPELIFNYFNKNNPDMKKIMLDDVTQIGINLGVSLAEMHSSESKSAVVSTEEIVNAKEKAEKIVELTSQVERLLKENTEAQNRIQSLLKELEKASKDKNASMSKKDSEIKEKLLEIGELNDEINRLKEELKTKDESIHAYEVQIKELESALKRMDSLITSLESKVTSLQNSLGLEKQKREEVVYSKEYAMGKDKVREETLDSLLLNLLSDGLHTAEELHKEVLKFDDSFSLKDIYDSLKRIKQKFYISNDSIMTIPRRYGIQMKQPESNKIFTLSSANPKKLLFISDLHINPNQNHNSLFDRMDTVYDYAAQKGIDTIVNLGDFFDTESDSFGDASTPISIYDKVCSIIETLDNNGFFADEFNNIILGGNHDISILSYGVDPLALLEENVPSVTSVGYSHAKLRIGNDTIGLHHEIVPRLDDENPVAISEFVSSFLKKYYHTSSLENRKSKYDMFSHIHRSLVDQTIGYSIVPSLTRDRFCDGLTEVDVYLNENGNIDYLVIDNLVYFPSNVIRKASENIISR